MPHQPPCLIQLDTIDESYNPWSDQFRYHSLYENLPDTDCQGLEGDLAAFASAENQKYFTIPLLTEGLINAINNNETYPRDILAEANVFRKLGLYDKFTDNRTGIVNYKLTINRNYCDEVDMLNLIQPSNLFQHYNVLSTLFLRMLYSSGTLCEFLSRASAKDA